MSNNHCCECTSSEKLNLNSIARFEGFMKLVKKKAAQMCHEDYQEILAEIDRQQDLNEIAGFGQPLSDWRDPPAPARGFKND